MFVTFLLFFFVLRRWALMPEVRQGTEKQVSLRWRSLLLHRCGWDPSQLCPLHWGVSVTSGLTAMFDLYFPLPMLPIHMSIRAVGHACEGPCCLFFIVKKSLVIFWSSKSEPSKPSLCTSKIARKMLEPNHTHGKIVTSTWIGGLWVCPEQNSPAPPGS